MILGDKIVNECVGIENMENEAKASIMIGNEKLHFQQIHLMDANPYGRDIIVAAGHSSVDEYLLFSISSENRLNKIYPDDIINLSKLEMPRFLIFKSDKSSIFTLDDEKIEWGDTKICGSILKKLSNKRNEDCFVWQINIDTTKEIIMDNQMVDLTCSIPMKFESTKSFKINIEGKEHNWATKTISVDEIAELGNWNISEGVVEINSENIQRSLNPGETIEIDPECIYGMQMKFQRGTNRSRIDEEIDLLKSHFESVTHSEMDGMHWILVNKIETPSGWTPTVIPVIFNVSVTYPDTSPYGFFVPAELNYEGSPPFESTMTNINNFTGNWNFLSWAPAGEMKITPDIKSGFNLWLWVCSFSQRIYLTET